MYVLILFVVIIMANAASANDQAWPAGGSVVVDDNGQMFFSDSNATVSLQEIAALVQQVSALSAQLEQAADLTARMGQQLDNVVADMCTNTYTNQQQQQLSSNGSGLGPVEQSAATLPVSLFQSIPTMGASDWEFFSIGGDSYLAVANHNNISTPAVNSQIFKYDTGSKAFVLFQSIPTIGATSWKFFTIRNQSYLAVSNQNNGGVYTLNSQIFRFSNPGSSGTMSNFVLVQNIPTVGAMDWEFFTINNSSYLVVANYRNGSNYRMDSQIYRFEPQQYDTTGIGSFSPFQAIPTVGAYDWEYFSLVDDNLDKSSNGSSSSSSSSSNDSTASSSLGRQHFLVVASNSDGVNLTLNSQIYRFNGTMFVPFQSIPTVAANGWEFFAIARNVNTAGNVGDGSESTSTEIISYYLAVACYSNNYNTYSQIFRYSNTTSTFVLIQAINSTGASNLQFFLFNGRGYLAVANYFNTALGYTIDSLFFSAQQLSTNSSIGANNNNNNNSSNTTDVVQLLQYRLLTSGAADIEYFTIKNESFLAVANQRSSAGVSLDSQIFRLHGICMQQND